MPPPLVVAAVVGVARLAAMLTPRIIQLGRAAVPAIARNAPKVINKGKQLIKQGVDTGSRLIKEYGPPVGQAASGAFKATGSVLSGLARGAGRGISKAFGRRQGGAGRPGGGGGARGGALKEAIKGMVKLEGLKQLLSFFGSDKETDQQDRIADTTAPTREPSGKELATTDRNNVARMNTLAATSNDGTNNAPTVPGQGIATRGGEGRGDDEYVTYSALYKILQDFAEATKGFIASALQSLLPPISVLETSTLNLSESIKSLADLLETSAKQELARKKEESAEAPYKRQTDKELLDEIRGKDPTQKKGLGLVDLIKNTLLALGFVAGITPPKNGNEKDTSSESNAAADNQANTASPPVGSIPSAPVGSTPGVSELTTGPDKQVSAPSTPVVSTQITPGPSQTTALPAQPPIDGVSLPLSQVPSNLPASASNVTRMAPQTRTLVPSDVSSFMPTGKKTIQNMVSASINKAINLIDQSVAAKKTGAPPAPIVLPAMGSAPTSSPSFSSTNQSPTVFALPSFMSNEPIGELNFI